MAVAAEVAGLLLVFHYEYFASSADFKNFRIYFGAVYIRSAYSSIRTIIYQKDLVEGHCVPFFIFPFHFLDSNSGAFRHFVLLAAGCYYCKFHGPYTTAIIVKRQIPDILFPWKQK